MKVSASSGVQGKWLDKKVLQTGQRVKIKTEATEQPSQQGGVQLVAKLLVQGQMDALNVGINKPSKNALIKAFGDETSNWIDKELTIHIESTIISGKRGIVMYLIPEGFEVKEDLGGYIVVIPKNQPNSQPDSRIEEADQNLDIDNIPF